MHIFSGMTIDLLKSYPLTLHRHILHDWNDADSIKIIKSLVPALRDGARVLVAEGIMPSPPATRSATLDSKNVR